ncbi:MAG: cofactor-independent phosphoglycerate mutase [Oligoflexia bacterium]|nr:cofactor-independent phosphoglycerate mutase [Oligoflexia bacterium]
MKYIIVVCDGMADHPVRSLNNKTPLMAAHTPCMDMLAGQGYTGLFKTIPESLPAGSEVANLSIMGYDPEANYCQRGVLEAASLGVELKEKQLAMRCNFIYTKNGIIISHSGGEIGSELAAKYINSLNNKFAAKYGVKFHKGKQYRHLLVLNQGDKRIKCQVPHDNIGKPVSGLMITAEHPDAAQTASVLNQLIVESRKIFPEDESVRCPNLIWPWAADDKPNFKSLTERTGLKGAVISAVDLIKGLGIYAGMDIIDVKGATGTADTNYEGKAQAAIDALKKYDYIFLHIEAADEAGHDGNTELKIKVIENIDSRLLSKIVTATEKSGYKARIAVLPDHPTPVESRLHIKEPVPVLISGYGITPDAVQEFNEETVKSGSLGLMDHVQWEKALGVI